MKDEPRHGDVGRGDTGTPLQRPSHEGPPYLRLPYLPSPCHSFIASPSSVLVVDRGSGTLTTNAVNVTFLSGTTDIFNAGNSDPAGMALTIEGGANLQNNGSILELRVSTLGFDNVTISFVFQRSDTGFNSIVTRESIDGTTFQGFSFVSPTTNFWGGSHTTFFPTGPVNNNPFFALRITISGATSEAGNLRFDNIVVSGTQIVPEPATMLLLGTGLAGVAATVRRRRRDRGR